MTGVSTPRGSSTRARITVTIRRDLVAAAEAAVSRGEARSVSAYVERAVAGQSEQDSLAEVLADIFAAHGEPTEEQELWARRALGL